MLTPIPSRGFLLIVDDDENNRDLISRRLEIEDFTTQTVADGRAALDLIEQEGFDLIILDVMMPGMSGLEVLAKIREKHSISELPVIMATAKDASGDVIEALEAGASDYVTKPIDFPVLVARLETQLTIRRLARTKDEFLRMASHDLKNPLQAVLSSVSVLAQEVPPGATMDEEMFEFITVIENRVNQMERIISDFLDFQAYADGRIELHRVPIALNDLVRDSIARNADYAKEKGIRVSAELTESLGEVQADPARLEQVLENLIGNAIKFSGEGAQVEIKSQGDGAAQIVEVRDTGPGLTPEDLERVFVKYARLSNRPTGGEVSTGLGLAICKQLIELHSGEIGAHNNPTGGSTFWFKLPTG